MKKHTWTIVGVVAVVLLIGSFVVSNNASNKANEGITFTPHIKGNPDAEVVLTEYSDLQCPACAQAFPVVQSIVDEYGDSIAFEYKHFPLVSIHPYALPAARAAEAAGQQGKFFEMHDLLFENQSVWGNSGNPQVYFIQYAEELGLNVEQFKLQMNASVIGDKVMGEFREAQQKGYTGTPTFEINGQRVQFASFADLITQIETAIGATSTEETTEAPVEFGI